jgi:hypothetical protein
VHEVLNPVLRMRPSKRDTTNQTTQTRARLSASQ